MEVLAEKLRGLSKGLLPAVGTESGERGRESVGEGVPTTKLFLLLLRQLEKKEGINLGKQRTGRTGQARTCRSLYVMPVPGDMAAITLLITDLLPQGRSIPRDGPRGYF